MNILFVVNNPQDWPFEIAGVQVVAAKAYLINPEYSQLRGAKVFNLCRSYRYHTIGYYVSLLAEARGHKPLPNISTIQDMKYQSIIKVSSEELDDLIQKSLAPIRSKEFVLSIYFGKNMAMRYNRLCLNLFNLFPVPLLRAYFVYEEEQWILKGVKIIPTSEIPTDHISYIIQFAKEYFSGRLNLPKRTLPRYYLAILYNKDEKTSPSNEKAIQKFIKNATSLGFGTEIIEKNDYGRLGEFDALLIRETTNVNHYTYRFSLRAKAEGLVVIDDPDSILKCTNKVYLAELLERHRVPIPKTMIVHRKNIDAVALNLGFPCILKQPDGSFSQGVVKVDNEEALKKGALTLLDNSELIIAQEFIRTEFDWRIGILDHHPLFACKYFMADEHWQIMKWESSGDASEGRFETVPVEFVPQQIIKLALKAANLIGDGFYGVDIKQAGQKGIVIEINDNPNIDSGVEDRILKDELYTRILSVMLKRIERQKERKY